MKRLLVFILLSLIFLFSLFSESEQPLSEGFLFNYTIDLHGGSLYVDDSGQSFLYGSSFRFKAEKSQKQYFLNATYTGLFSSLKFADFKLNNGLFSAGFSNNLLQVEAGLFTGKMPDTLNARIDKVYFNLTDFSYIGGFTDFHCNFTDSISLKLSLFAGSQKTDTSNLYIVFGKVKSPFFAGGHISLNLPYDFNLSSTYSAVKIQLLSGSNDFLGDGLLDYFDLELGKLFIIEPHTVSQSDTEVVQKIKTNIGFLYSGGNGQATSFLDTYNTLFYPFSYLYANGKADLYFLSFAADYSVTKNHFNLLINSSLFVNIYSRMNYFYKATYKKNLFYDGSIKRGSDSFDFSNGDLLLLMRAKVFYSYIFSSSIKVDFFLQKDLALPLISSKTQALFSGESEEEIKTQSSDFSSSLLRTALLSGLSLGIQIDF